jgi:LEA14-like dessication related protein
MKNSIKKILLIFFSLLLVAIIIFCISPRYWLALTQPVQIQINTAHARITEDKIFIKLDAEISIDYYLDVIIDSMAYKVYMGDTEFSRGTIFLDRDYKKGVQNILTIPVDVDKKILEATLKKMEPTDTAKIRVVFRNYLDLPLFGKQEMEMSIVEKTLAPKIIEVEVLKMKKIKLKLHDAVFDVDLAIKNPGMHKIVINAVKGKINFKDLFVGKVNHKEQIIIGPMETTVVQTKVDFDELELIKDGLNVLFHPNKQWEYMMNADVILEKEDGSTMLLDISNAGKMDLMEKNKPKKKKDK